MRLILALSVAVAIALPVGAEHCETWTTSEPVSDLSFFGLPYYLDHDLCQDYMICPTWVYEETNGITGLQRGDDIVDDTCHGQIESDAIVF